MKIIIFLSLIFLCASSCGQETFTVIKVDTVKQEYSMKSLTEQRARLVQSANELRLEIQKIDSLLQIGGMIIEKQLRKTRSLKVPSVLEITTPLRIPANIDAGLNNPTQGKLLDISTKSSTINN